jgi:putative FmdB family regulatory protein
MPFYDFRCKHCEHTFTVRASFQEKEAGLRPECPVCNAVETQQLLTAGIFIGKAGGLLKEQPAPSSRRGGCCGPGGFCG